MKINTLRRMLITEDQDMTHKIPVLKGERDSRRNRIEYPGYCKGTYERLRRQDQIHLGIIQVTPDKAETVIFDT